ncbi:MULTISPECIES: phage tail tube protein [Brucella/Ochrobactrum group]|uniref:phage tail tube protein n=1 Tax=Brucella/Ochrobactrum group TaxID=2826938 RepID=UPI000464EF78|nr:phage tail tube protein [Brucella rhizosphaerae]
MAQATTIKSGKIRVLLGNDATPTVYSAPCGFTQRSITITKGLEEVNIPDCTDPDKVDWVGRDATSLSMGISGEGVLAAESVDDWLDAVDSIDSIPVKVEWEFPTKTIVWTGFMHVESMEVGATNGQRATNNVSLQSDGVMVRTSTPAGG